MKISACLLSFFLLIFVSACREKTPSTSDLANNEAPRMDGGNISIPTQAPVAGELVITAKLMEIPGSFRGNDLYNSAYVMKYQVLTVMQGNYDEGEILVGHYNPRIARVDIKDEQDAKVGGNVKSFQTGDIHYLVLANLDAVWTGATDDSYYTEKRPRYWGLWADKVK